MGNSRWRLFMARICALVLMLFLFPALLHAGFNRSKIPQIACGKTTAGELERLLGKPKSATDNSDGSKTWVYQEGKFVPSVIFTVQVSPFGVVDTYSLRSSTSASARSSRARKSTRPPWTRYGTLKPPKRRWKRCWASRC